MDDFRKIKFNFFSKENIILLILLIAIILFIVGIYNTQLNRKTYIIGIYLYILAGLLFIAIASQYIASLNFVNSKNYFMFLILYLVLACGSLFIMMSNNFLINHIGFLLFLIAMSLIVGLSIRSSSFVKEAAFITIGIVILLTILVFISPEGTLERMRSWTPVLMSLLCALIIVELAALFFFPSVKLFKYLSLFALILFIFITLSDTARITTQDFYICKIHSCINYPLATTTLILDYINIFLNALFLRTF